MGRQSNGVTKSAEKRIVQSRCYSAVACCQPFSGNSRCFPSYQHCLYVICGPYVCDDTSALQRDAMSVESEHLTRTQDAGSPIKKKAAYLEQKKTFYLISFHFLTSCCSLCCTPWPPSVQSGTGRIVRPEAALSLTRFHTSSPPAAWCYYVARERHLLQQTPYLVSPQENCCQQILIEVRASKKPRKEDGGKEKDFPRLYSNSASFTLVPSKPRLKKLCSQRVFTLEECETDNTIFLVRSTKKGLL